MKEFFEAIVLQLPPWAIWPVAIIGVLVFAVSTLRDMWKELLPSYRVYSREKRRLELLKLHYEVEAIRKEHQLPEPKGVGSSKSISRRKKSIGWISASMYGGLGGCVMNSIRLFRVFWEMPELGSGAYILGLLIGFVTLFTISAVITAVTEPRSKSDAFVRGLAVGAVVVALSSA